MKTKVLLIGPFPEPISGVSLANKVVHDLLKKSTNFNPIVLNTSYPYFNEKIGRFTLKKLLFFFKLNINFVKIFKADIVYMTPGQTFFGVTKYSLFIILSKLLKKETIIHVHGNHLGECYKSLTGFKKKLFNYLVSSFSKGIVLSNSLRSNLNFFLEGKNIYALPNFAEDYLFEDLVYKKIDKLHIVFLSNLMQEKGILVLLDALQELELKNISYEAKIAGNIDVELKDAIELKLKNLKFTEYLGVVRGEEKKKLLAWSNTFVLPTFYKMEGQPISILEALATQNIIITTKHAGIPDVINTTNGFFVEKNNSKSLVEVFILASNNLKNIEKISLHNIGYFKDNYSIEKFKNNLISIFNE